MELERENNIKIEQKSNNFLNTLLGKTINNAIDIGLRAILPDLIENQVIDIKNSLLENGLKGGIKNAIDSSVDLAKSALGIFTGNFENMSQVKIAVGQGGMVETISNVFDNVLNKTFKSGHINKTTNLLIKNGKNIIFQNIKNNIEKEFNNQTFNIEKLEKTINNWKKCYNNKDFSGMSKEYNKIEKQLNNIIPLENILKETRKIETIHNFIKNNGHNFEITELEKELIKKFS